MGPDLGLNCLQCNQQTTPVGKGFMKIKEFIKTPYLDFSFNFQLHHFCLLKLFH